MGSSRRSRNKRARARSAAPATPVAAAASSSGLSGLWWTLGTIALMFGVIVPLVMHDRWMAGIAMVTCNATRCSPVAMTVAGWAVVAVLALPFAAGAVVRADLRGWVLGALIGLGVVLALPTAGFILNDGILDWLRTLPGGRAFAMGIGHAGWGLGLGGLLYALLRTAAGKVEGPAARALRAAAWISVGAVLAGGLVTALLAAARP